MEHLPHPRVIPGLFLSVLPRLRDCHDLKYATTPLVRFIPARIGFEFAAVRFDRCGFIPSK
jgi:hypothetical protein